MGIEIERKFLVRGDGWWEGAAGTDFRQGYLPTGENCVVRVRIQGATAILTIKGRTEGIERLEFEYPIPLTDAETLLSELCEKPLIEKTRFRMKHGAHVWEIDEFRGDNRGLVLAEVELSDAQESVELPDWVGEEVSDDPRYFNVNLVRHPFPSWKDGGQ